MTLEHTSFLGDFGFEENPFTVTNADEEPELPSYFVPPPYFASVLGSPTKAKSAVVFAPRGGGKTAQKVMIENAAISNNGGGFLCITYDSFDLPPGFTVSSATAEWHLTNIVRKLITALLIAADEPAVRLKLSSAQQNSLAKAAVIFLSKLTEADFRRNIESLRNWRGKIEHYWERYGGKIANLLTAVAARFNVGSLEKLADAAKQNHSSVTEYFRQLIGVSKSLGYQSIYVLVDRIDETRATSNNAGAAFEFIKEIINDLHVLEMQDVAFKFFLWDQTKQLYYADGARPDRIPIYELDWTADQIGEMLTKRLMTFSHGQVRSFQSLFRREVAVDFHRLICYLAAGSPRDMIRMAKAIVDEHTKTVDEPSLISFSTAEIALRKFAVDRSKELYPQFAIDLPKVGLAKFDLASLSSSFIRSGRETVKQKLQKWLESGLVSQSLDGHEDENASERTFYFTDPRIVLAIKCNYERLTTILRTCLLVCGKCGELNTSEAGFEYCDCHHCGSDVDQRQNLLARLNQST